MRQLIRISDFDRALANLPPKIQKLCESQLSLLAANPRDPRLHVKSVKGFAFYSFRITRHYRGFFYFGVDDTVVVFDIDHRKDSYRKL